MGCLWLVTWRSSTAIAVDVISAHYPAAFVHTNCLARDKVQWASEDMSVRWDTGARCWARELNQNYARVNLTATIAWALLACFNENLAFAGTGMLHAVKPRPGFCQTGQVIWALAHRGQFTKSGWFFLQHGSGVGVLDNGGSYVTLTEPTTQPLMIIVETMIRNTSQCQWGTSVEYKTTEQIAIFQLDSSFAHVTQLFVFFSNFSTIDVKQAFIHNGIIAVDSGAFILPLPVEVVYTFLTINGAKGAYEAPPASTPFSLADAVKRRIHILLLVIHSGSNFWLSVWK